MARGLKLQIKVVEGLYYEEKIKVLISCAVIAQLICAFVFTYAISRFSQDVAQMIWFLQYNEALWLKYADFMANSTEANH